MGERDHSAFPFSMDFNFTLWITSLVFYQIEISIVRTVQSVFVLVVIEGQGGIIFIRRPHSRPIEL